MSSIKDVAREANVSISTVSIIVNGKEKERKISDNTVNKVKEVMKKLGYVPNVSAKKLRTNSDRKTIALYWTNDFRGIMLPQFISGIENTINELDLNYDLIIYPYKINHLKDEPSITQMNYHGAIIANCSNEDLEYLNSINPLVPVTLYNRKSVKYHSVYVDDELIAHELSSLIKDKDVTIIKAPAVFEGMNIRDEKLKEYLSDRSISEYLLSDNSAKEAYTQAHLFDLKGTVCCDSDLIALGIMHYCYKNNVRIPEDIRLVAVGNGLNTISEYLNPSLSIVSIPLEEMARECIIMTDKLLNNLYCEDVSIKPKTYIRSSIP